MLLSTKCFIKAGTNLRLFSFFAFIQPHNSNCWAASNDGTRMAGGTVQLSSEVESVTGLQRKNAFTHSNSTAFQKVSEFSKKQFITVCS